MLQSVKFSLAYTVRLPKATVEHQPTSHAPVSLHRQRSPPLLPAALLLRLQHRLKHEFDSCQNPLSSCHSSPFDDVPSAQ